MKDFINLLLGAIIIAPGIFMLMHNEISAVFAFAYFAGVLWLGVKSELVGLMLMDIIESTENVLKHFNLW